MFTTDFMVCGIGPHGDNIVVLTYDENEIQQEVRAQHIVKSNICTGR